jgi:hypothetical protein
MSNLIDDEVKCLSITGSDDGDSLKENTDDSFEGGIEKICKGDHYEQKNDHDSVKDTTIEKKEYHDEYSEKLDIKKKNTIVLQINIDHDSNCDIEYKIEPLNSNKNQINYTIYNVYDTLQDIFKIVYDKLEHVFDKIYMFVKNNITYTTLKYGAYGCVLSFIIYDMNNLYNQIKNKQIFIDSTKKYHDGIIASTVLSMIDIFSSVKNNYDECTNAIHKFENCYSHIMANSNNYKNNYCDSVINHINNVCLLYNAETFKAKYKN